MNIGNLVNRRMGLVAVVSLAFGSTAAWGGTIKGTTTFKGDPLKRKVIKMAADPSCVAANKGKAVGTEKVIVGKPDDKQIRTIRNVMVYVKSVPTGLAQETPEASLTLDQRGCRYRPHVLTIQTGQTLTVLNSDATLHNIHGLPKKNSEFNFGQPRAGLKRALVFKKAEIFRVKCDVHPWMGAYIGVFDHPFHAVSDKVGNYQIDGLPAGTYEIIAWHEVYGEFKQKVTVKADGETKLDFELSETKK